MRDDNKPADDNLEHIRAARQQFEAAVDRARGSAGVFAGAFDIGSVGGAQVAHNAIPGYDIQHEIHRGGQGVVYEAVQQSTNRTVAIKMLHGGRFGDPRHEPRFEREVQILSQLNHPNIVTIHDSGLADGYAFFVMDFVNGQPLDAFMEDTDRDVRPTLELFGKVCDAVNAAHLRGVIHRDLKPGNILIDRAGQPHVLDFGLAKVSEFDVLASDGASAMTTTGQFVGSVPWASPEQASGDHAAVDTRTDVYALGIVLYHMLTSRFPYRVAGNLRDVLDAIMTVEPARPSSFRRKIGDEVETIILKCLSKSPQRRYLSAGELSRDVSNYLAGRPIEAKRDSGWYVLRKTLRRYRVATGVAAAFLVLIATSLVALSVAFGRAENAREAEAEQRHKAERHAVTAAAAAAEAEAVSAFLQDMLAAPDPHKSGRDVTVREVLADAEAKLDEEFADQPAVAARLHATIGETYLWLGDYERAEPHLRQALELREEILGETHHDTLLSMNALGILLRKRGQVGEALDLYTHAGDISERELGPDDEVTLSSQSNAAGALIGLGRYDDAQALMDDVVPRARAALGNEHEQTLNFLSRQASLHRFRGRFAESEILYLEILPVLRRKYGDDSPKTQSAVNNLSTLYFDMGRFADAEPLVLESLEARRRVLGDDHPDTIVSIVNLANVYIELGRQAEAEPLLLDALEYRRRVLGDEHHLTVVTMNQLGALYETVGRLDEAAAMHGEALAIRRRVHGDKNPNTLISINNLAGVYMKQGEHDQAEALFAENVAAAPDVFPEGHWVRGGFLARHGGCLLQMGRYAEAEPQLLDAYDIMVDALGPDDGRVQKVRDRLAELYTAWDKPEKADEWRMPDDPVGD